MEHPQQQLLKVLRLTKEILSLPDNDFAWSSWNDAGEAIREIDDFITAIENKQPFDELSLRVLYAATGNIQEVSMSSGWPQAFLNVAKDFDVALESFQKSKR